MREFAKTGVPMGRPGTSGEIAEAVLFLASPAASYIVGQILTVDGGMGIVNRTAGGVGSVAELEPRLRDGRAGAG